MIIQSPAFEDQQIIPAKYTCQGEDISPPLQFIKVPQGAKSLLLIVDDPDAPTGTFVHWIVWNISPHLKGFAEGAKELFQDHPEAGQGVNGFGAIGYGGPCPPAGKPHHYHFRLYALDVTLNLKDKVSRKEIEQAMKGHVLDQAELVGIYQRT